MGDRVRGDKRYVKVYSLNERENLLRSRYPHYIHYDEVFGGWLESVPLNLVAKHYQPTQKTIEIFKGDQQDKVKADLRDFINELHDATSISLGNIGVSGSVLVDLHTTNSDIDTIIYGRNNCVTAYNELRSLLNERRRGFSPFDHDDLKKLYNFRSRDTLMPFKEFCFHESRKAFQGKFRGRAFFIRFVVDWSEIGEKYGDRIYRDVGYARVKAVIEDDSNSIFTPCSYRIFNVKVLEGKCDEQLLDEIVSFRGRFCDQAKKGESIIAQGKVERVIERDGSEHYRIVLGNRSSDFMIVEGIS